MNIKDRLKSTKNSEENIVLKKENPKKTSIADIFADGKYVQTLVRNYIKDYKNIIFLNNSSFDSSFICEYFKSFTIKGEKVKITNSVSLKEVQINIIPEPTVKDIVKIFENIILSDKSYIFGLKIKTYDNILSKLRALISVNYPNMSQDSIDVLINSSECVIVYFSKNDDGLYIISKIEEMHNIEGEIVLEKIFDTDSAFVLSSDESVSQEDNSAENIETVQNSETPLSQEENIIGEKVEIENELKEEKQVITVDNKRTIKVNKYKLLRDKIKRKKEQV